MIHWHERVWASQSRLTTGHDVDQFAGSSHGHSIGCHNRRTALASISIEGLDNQETHALETRYLGGRDDGTDDSSELQIKVSRLIGPGSVQEIGIGEEVVEHLVVNLRNDDPRHEKLGRS